MTNRDRSSQKNDSIVNSEGLPPNPDSDRSNADRIGQAKTDGKLKRVDVADMRFHLNRIRHGVMRCEFACYPQLGRAEPRLDKPAGRQVMQLGAPGQEAQGRKCKGISGERGG